MKKVFKSLVVVAVLVVALASTSAVFAQTTSPGSSNPGNPTGSASAGAMGNGRRGGYQVNPLNETQDGILHDEMVAAFAEALGLTVDEINERLADGETMSEIALSTGMNYDEFIVLLNEIHEQVIDQVVGDGVMTQDQARLYLAREARAGGMFGLNDGRSTMMGQGLYGTNDCPYYE
jgi:hypothetical protein